MTLKAKLVLSHLAIALLAALIGFAAIYIDAQQYRSVIVLTVLMTVILAVTLGHRLEKDIADPLSELTDAAANYFGGELNIDFDGDSPTEIEMLDQLFSTMMQRVAKARCDLISKAEDLHKTTSKLMYETKLRSRTERALQHSQNRYRRVVEQVADMLLVFNLQGEIIEVNEHACQSLGYERDQLLGKFITDIDAGLCKEELSNVWQKLSPGHPLIHSTSYRHKKGGSVPVELRMGALEVASEPLVLAVAHDLSTRHELQDICSRFQFISDSASEYISLIDTQRAYVAVNDAYCDAIGCEREELLGQTVEQVWGAVSYNNGIRQQLDQAFAGETVCYQKEIEFPNLGHRLLDVTLRPYLNESNELTHVLVMSVDAATCAAE